MSTKRVTGHLGDPDRSDLAREAPKGVRLGRKHHAWIELPVEDIIARYSGGESVKSIADSLGVSRNVIDRRLRKNGIEPRGTGEASLLRAASRTPEENRRNTEAAHRAVRGMKRTPEDLARRALGKERNQSHATEGERYFAKLLEDRGMRTTLQKAVGPYNIDIAAGPVAVEIYGGNWHGSGRHAARAPERFRYLLDQGWPFVIIWVSGDVPMLLPEAADYVSTFAEVASSDPSSECQYRVIWGDGQEAAVCQPDLDQIAAVPARRRR